MTMKRALISTGNAHVPGGGQVRKGPNFPLVFKWKGKHHTLKRGCTQPKQVKTSFFKPIELKRSRKGRGEVRA